MRIVVYITRAVQYSINSAVTKICSVVYEMTRPKKWFLNRDDGAGGIIVTTSDGPLRKANSSKPLGRILGVSTPTEEQAGRYTVDESVLVSSFSSLSTTDTNRRTWYIYNTCVCERGVLLLTHA